jgi:hypothetical protein
MTFGNSHHPNPPMGFGSSSSIQPAQTGFGAPVTASKNTGSAGFPPTTFGAPSGNPFTSSQPTVNAGGFGQSQQTAMTTTPMFGVPTPNQPPSTTNFGAFSQPASSSGFTAPPGGFSTSTPGGFHPTPAGGGGFSTTPATGGFSTTPAVGGFNTTPAVGGFSTTPAVGGFSTTPAVGGFNVTPAFTPQQQQSDSFQIGTGPQRPATTGKRRILRAKRPT